ncbi:hypothetical protein C8F04DRAFT_1174552 [Mycena alexandri]|uniref:Biotrophy-associated secreted protein 2 n=1 Tax=Mycena alexandri TaxID=1745969 RepID=A0AAD6TJ43_9AGAR|nr:hypothetical protein C8F04DRAFT_1174552 [Mycena alexandri]
MFFSMTRLIVLANVALLVSSAVIPPLSDDAVVEARDTPVARSGKQFITGACASDAACASGCCGFNTGKCAGPFRALISDGGCGHGNTKPRLKVREDAAAALQVRKPRSGVMAAHATATPPVGRTAVDSAPADVPPKALVPDRGMWIW